VALKNDLISLLSQQAVLMLSTQSGTLARIEARLANREFYADINEEDEDSAASFVSSHGGEVVRKVSAEVGASFDPLLYYCWM